MATRAVIKIEGVDYASIYKHYDGYPEGMLPWLKDFNKTNGNNSPLCLMSLKNWLKR
jgi:hypothetical protein